MSVRLELLTSDMPSHGRHTGYGQLVRHLPTAHIQAPSSPARIWHRLHRLAQSLGCPVRYYHAYHLRFEIRTGWRSLVGERTLAHCLYGEDQFWLLGSWRRSACLRTVLTLHQPPSTQSQLLAGTGHLARADGLIVLARSQLDWAATLAPRARVRFIPHGVDGDFFCPARPPPPTPPWQVLVVGGWQRDYAAAAECIRWCIARSPGLWRFVLVGCRDQENLFKDLPVELRSRLTDEELREVYRDSHLTLLPLKDATANNALLEALACGCPVLASSVGGVPDYASDPAWLLRHPVGSEGGKAIADRLHELAADPARLVEVRKRTRTLALTFNWPAVARQTVEFYREVCAGWTW